MRSQPLPEAESRRRAVQATRQADEERRRAPDKETAVGYDWYESATDERCDHTMKKSLLLLGAAAAYLFGTESGRQQVDKVRGKAQSLWEDQAVQDKVAEISDAVKSRST
jgi:hypothetical protein